MHWSSVRSLLFLASAEKEYVCIWAELTRLKSQLSRLQILWPWATFLISPGFSLHKNKIIFNDYAEITREWKDVRQGYWLAWELAHEAAVEPLLHRCSWPHMTHVLLCLYGNMGTNNNPYPWTLWIFWLKIPFTKDKFTILKKNFINIIHIYTYIYVHNWYESSDEATWSSIKTWT